jgi:hypothetical protein
MPYIEENVNGLFAFFNWGGENRSNRRDSAFIALFLLVIAAEFLNLANA